MHNQPGTFFLPLFLLLFQSCGSDTVVKKDKPATSNLGIVSANEQNLSFQETEVMAAGFDAGFEDETRSQYSNYDQNTYMFQGSASYNVSYTSANAAAAAPAQKPIRKTKKIIKNGTMRIQTEAFNESKKRIDQVVKVLKGYYENEELDKNDSIIQYRLIIRLPSGNFEKLVSGIEDGKDEIVFKKVNVNDVTEEFLDIETRLENKRRYLKRYKELLEKARNVNEILSIEENIRQLMEEIESKEGRLKYLNDQVDLSTLRINLFKEYPAKISKPVETPFSSKAGASLGKGWNSIIHFLLWIVSKWPVILLIGILAWIIRRKWKQRKAANAE